MPVIIRSNPTGPRCTAYGGGQGKWQVSNGGQQSEWSRDGKELYYMDLTFNVLSALVKEIGGGLQFGAAQMLVGTTNWVAAATLG